jgi:hypothetical protein
MPYHTIALTFYILFLLLGAVFLGLSIWKSRKELPVFTLIRHFCCAVALYCVPMGVALAWRLA